MAILFKHFFKQRSKAKKHQRKIENLKEKHQRKIEKCIAKYGGHHWEGQYYSSSGLTCKNCGYSKRHWAFGDMNWGNNYEI